MRHFSPQQCIAGLMLLTSLGGPALAQAPPRPAAQVPLPAQTSWPAAGYQSSGAGLVALPPTQSPAPAVYGASAGAAPTYAAPAYAAPAYAAPVAAPQPNGGVVPAAATMSPASQPAGQREGEVQRALLSRKLNPFARRDSRNNKSESPTQDLRPSQVGGQIPGGVQVTSGIEMPPGAEMMSSRRRYAMPPGTAPGGAAGPAMLRYGGAPIATALPPGGSGATAAGAPQRPLPQGGAVIVYMPAGWQPPEFAPRQISPEVPDEFWPGEFRHPLGDREGHGLFRWPRFAEEAATKTAHTPAESKSSAKPLFNPLADKTETEAKVPTPPSVEKAKALFGRSERAAEPQQTAAAEPTAKALFARSAPMTLPRLPPATNPSGKSKALFAFRRNKPAAATPTPEPRLASTPPEASATTPDVPQPAPPAQSRLAATASTATPTVMPPSPPEMKWRAKGVRTSESQVVESPPAAEPTVSRAAHREDSQTAVTVQVAQESAAQSQPVQQKPTAGADEPRPAPAAASRPASDTAPTASRQKALLPKWLAFGSAAEAEAGEPTAPAPTSPRDDKPQQAAAPKRSHRAHLATHQVQPTPQDDESARWMQSYYAPPVVPVAAPVARLARSTSAATESTEVAETTAAQESTVAEQRTPAAKSTEQETTPASAPRQFSGRPPCRRKPTDIRRTSDIRMPRAWPGRTARRAAIGTVRRTTCRPSPDRSGRSAR